MSDPARVIEDALELEPVERARVARILIASLDEGADAGSDESWRDEVRERVDAVESGAVSLEDWDVARERLRSSPFLTG